MLIFIEALNSRLEENAREFLRQGNKVKAKQVLRQKHLIATQLKHKDNQYSKLSSLMHNLDSAKEHKHV